MQKKKKKIKPPPREVLCFYCSKKFKIGKSFVGHVRAAHPGDVVRHREPNVSLIPQKRIIFPVVEKKEKKKVRIRNDITRQKKMQKVAIFQQMSKPL